MFKQYKDAAGKVYYKTLDEKYLIMKVDNTWSTYKYDGNNYAPGYIYNGYSAKWCGFDKLKNAKAYIEECVEEDKEWEQSQLAYENRRFSR